MSPIIVDWEGSFRPTVNLIGNWRRIVQICHPDAKWLLVATLAMVAASSASSETKGIDPAVFARANAGDPAAQYQVGWRYEHPDAVWDTVPELTEAEVEHLKSLAARPDSEIDYGDIPKLSDEQWKNAVRRRFHRPDKEQASGRPDTNGSASNGKTPSSAEHE
jgi:hypothetical protein